MKRKLWTGIASTLGMLILILDTKTALSGAQEGIRLSFLVVVPSLFPFIFLSILMTSALGGFHCRPLKPVLQALRMPHGCESLLMIGMLGGYPTGAQAVSTACQEGTISKIDAQRLLGFCNNAGPAFLFGMVALQFDNRLVPWFLWLIHILSAVAVGVMLPGCSKEKCTMKIASPVTPSQAISRSVKVTAQICGWIILFRVILAFLNRWFLWYVGNDMQILLNGILELANGCSSLSHVSCSGLRFIIASTMLCFGGLCVLLQTASVTGSVGMGMYLPGKILHCLCGTLLASVIQYLLFPSDQQVEHGNWFALICLVLTVLYVFLLRKREKRCSIPTRVGV